MANKKYVEERIRAESEKQLLSKRKRLRFFPLISLVIVLVLFLLMLTNWAAIYNTDIAGNEVEVSGYNCVSAGLSGNYTSTDKDAFGDMAVPFYYYAPNETRSLCGTTAAVLFVLIVHALIMVFAVITNKQGAFNILDIIFSIAESALFIACYAVAVSMNTSGILPGYCNSNPACSVQSHAILPALFAIFSIAAPVLAMVFDFRNKKQARLEEEAALQLAQSKSVSIGKKKRR